MYDVALKMGKTTDNVGLQPKSGPASLLPIKKQKNAYTSSVGYTIHYLYIYKTIITKYDIP